MLTPLMVVIFLSGCTEQRQYTSTTTTTLITGTEEYCHQFTYANCPDSCEVGPSCAICEDIGCHSKNTHKLETTTTLPGILCPDVCASIEISSVGTCRTSCLSNETEFGPITRCGSQKVCCCFNEMTTTTLAMVTTTTQLRTFTIEADDSGFYPSGKINVNKGDRVKITFVVKTTNTYFGGLDFRSIVWGDTGTVKPGESKTVEFTADNTFTFTSYWPISSVKKSDGQVVVV